MNSRNAIPKRILVGLDGSPGSSRALEWSIDMAKMLDAEIIAVHVIQPIPTLDAAYYVVTPPNAWEEELRELFEREWCAPLRDAGVRFRTVLEEGRPAPSLIAIAERERAGLMVTGTRGFGGFKELLMGSVSHQLVQHARIPVVVIPPECTERPEAIEAAGQ